MGREDGGNLGVKGLNGLEQGAELGRVGLDHETEWGDDRGVGREGHGGGDLLEPVGDHRGPAAVVLVIEPPHRGGARPLDGRERRPGPKEVAALLRGERPDPVEGLREVLLEHTGEPIRHGHAVLDQLPTLLAEEAQRPGRHRVGGPGAELVAMGTQEVQE